MNIFPVSYLIHSHFYVKNWENTQDFSYAVWESVYKISDSEPEAAHGGN